MAKIKIYESQLGVQSPSVPQVGSLAQPYELAVQFGAAVSKIGGNISAARDKRKETQNKNEARKIIKEIDPLLKEEFGKHSLSTDIGSITTFFENTDIKKFRSNLKWKNKRIKQLVGDYIYKEQIQYADKLNTQITVNHGEETKATHDDELRQIKFKMSANDSTTRDFGYKDFDSWFIDPSNIDKYTPTALTRLKRDTLAEARKLQLQFQIRNDPKSVIENIDEILKEFPDEDGKLVLKNAAEVFVSKAISEDMDEIRLEKANTDQKIHNFAEIVKRLNNKNDPDYSLKIPTLDDIADFFKMDQINSTQYAALIDFYSEEDKVSQSRIVDMINAQLAVAKGVEDIDVLERQINFDQEFMLNLNIDDYSTFKEIFEKYKTDQPGMLNFQHFFNKLDTNLGKIENSGGYSLGGKTTAGEKDTQLTRIDGLKMYKDLIRKNVLPSDAYILTIKAFMNENTMPTIYKVIQPTSIKILKPEKGQVADPAKWFEDKRKEVLEKYKDGVADINTYQEDLQAIDVIEDIFKVRQSIGNTAFAFSDIQDSTPAADTGN